MTSFEIFMTLLVALILISPIVMIVLEELQRMKKIEF